MKLSFVKYEYTKCVNEDPYGQSFIENMFLRKCCYKCQFKVFPKLSDISLGDFWKVDKKYDIDDKGCSLVICNSEKGVDFFKTVEGYFYDEIPIEKAFPGNHALYKSSEPFKRRKTAFNLLKK